MGFTKSVGFPEPVPAFFSLESFLSNVPFDTTFEGDSLAETADEETEEE